MPVKDLNKAESQELQSPDEAPVQVKHLELQVTQLVPLLKKVPLMQIHVVPCKIKLRVKSHAVQVVEDIEHERQGAVQGEQTAPLR